MAQEYGYSAQGTSLVVRDSNSSYARWAPNYSVILAISSKGLLANMQIVEES